ncbi:hypothetical protein SAMN05216359_102573 [Roseateles sp. YR242]|uniref:hypothetical protein n=1 Tax=Roseateles sp. YR242 TaxID=1855305 RepID=UPI0008B8C195|nr:hypothetical protein [Roseateles sp. YR242]SEK65684.1 hypothetical protein SAMN05216359_102573 [Roseateles sp. YR242]
MTHTFPFTSHPSSPSSAHPSPHPSAPSFDTADSPRSSQDSANSQCFSGDSQASVGALLDSRPLRDMNEVEFEGFLYWSRMYPSRSRFMPGNAEWLAPRRDITVRVALETLRERMQQAAASVELVARLERDHVDENPLPDDDEALVVSAAVRDNLREAMGMLGVIERALERGTPTDMPPFTPDNPSGYEVREPAAFYTSVAMAA